MRARNNATSLAQSEGPSSKAPSPPQTAPDVIPSASSLPDIGASTPSGPSPQPSQAHLNELREHLKRDPGNAGVRVELAALLSIQGKDSEAEDVLRSALQRGLHTPEIYHTLGMLYLHNEQYAPAVQAFTVETSLRPKDFQAHLKLATAYAQLSRVDDAMREYNIAKAIDATEPDTYLGMAYMNNSSERYPYAVQYLKEYIKRSPQPGPGYGLLCRVYLNMKLYDEAVDAGKTAVKLMPTNAAICYTLGQAYSYRPGDQYLNDAALAFEQAVRLSPKWGRARFELAHVYSRQHRIPDAIAQYRESVRLEPSRGTNHYQLGQLLMQQGQVDEGTRELAQAKKLIALNQRESQLQEKIAAMPSNPRFLFELGELYKEMGNYSEAEVWLKDAMKIDPKYPNAEAELQKVHGMSSVSHRD